MPQRGGGCGVSYAHSPHGDRCISGLRLVCLARRYGRLGLEKSFLALGHLLGPGDKDTHTLNKSSLPYIMSQQQLLKEEEEASRLRQPAVEVPRDAQKLVDAMVGRPKMEVRANAGDGDSGGETFAHAAVSPRPPISSLSSNVAAPTEGYTRSESVGILCLVRGSNPESSDSLGLGYRTFWIASSCRTRGRALGGRTRDIRSGSKRWAAARAWTLPNSSSTPR
jgi:hypothetical protein